MKRLTPRTPYVMVWLIGIMVFILGIVTGITWCLALYTSPLESAREAVTTQYLQASSLGCTDPSDPIKPTDRVAVFKKYLKVNKLLNRAVIRGCNDHDSLLALAPNGSWERTDVNISLDTRANPAWSRECLVDDILVADDTVRPENSSIDEFNLEACTALSKLNIVRIGDK